MPRFLIRASKPLGAVLLLLLPMVPVLVLGAQQAAAASASGEPINVIAAHSGKCLTTENGSVEAGARIVQSDCTGDAVSSWRLQQSPSGLGTLIVNVAADKCLEIENGSSTVGAQARLALCTGQPGADFVFADQGTHVWLQPRTGTPPGCLGVDQASHANAAPVKLGACDDAIGTRFHQRPARAGNDPAQEEPPQPAPSVQRVNLSGSGGQSSGAGGTLSDRPVVSADGRYIAFESFASDLVPGDTNGRWDVFVRDRQTGTTERVSVSTGGLQGDDASGDAVISADGRYIAFASQATTLVTGDTNGRGDVFVRDRQTGTTTRVSVATGGLQGDGAAGAPSVSADGRYIAFQTNSGNYPGDTNLEEDVYLRDLQNETTTRVSVTSAGLQANGRSRAPAISADGQYVAFTSRAVNLVTGDANGQEDVFVRGLRSGVVERVSVSTSGAEADERSFAPSISTDGRHVAFTARAANLVPGDTNNADDAFVRDRQNRTTERVNVPSGGAQSSGGSSSSVGLSGNGRFVVFASHGTDLVAGDTNGRGDVFVRDRRSAVTTRVSTSVGGVQGNGDTSSPSISQDGRYLAFHSHASNLIPGDTNGADDYFLRTRVVS